MNISSVSAAGAVDASSPETVIMAKKALNQQKQDGQSAVALIQGAAAPPPPRAGHALSVYA